MDRTGAATARAPAMRDQSASAIEDSTFDAIAAIAHREAGLSLPREKSAMVAARLRRRMGRLGISSFEEYLRLITDPDGTERRRMVAALTTNVSSFFREPHHFEALRAQILPDLLERAAAGARLRIWSAGCANGQEAYSIALTILDLAPDASSLDIRILGTDIDPSVVRFSELGTYHSSMMGDVPERMRSQYFVFDSFSNTFRAADALRQLVLFRDLNLHGPWPMPGRFDVIFCRNVVIYFDEAGQKSLWPRFEDRLTDSGWLIVGHSERIAEDTAPRLEQVAHTIYRVRA